MKEYDEKQLKELIEQYQRKLEKIYFAAPERKWADELDGTENILEIIKHLMDSSVELNHILEQCPDSIYVTDQIGMTQRVNRAFEETTGVKREKVLYRNVLDLEEDGVFRPSVCSLVMKEKRKVSLLQAGKKGTAVVIGVPVLDDKGDIYKIITNARALNEINEIVSYIEKQGIQKNEDNEPMIAESDEMKQVLEIAKQVASVDSNVLITGESGVGKGVLARFIHNHSYRRDGALVQINCGAIPETLLESELFGYESGAFTGADKRGKPGLIELANKGTLFLDEIGELPMLMQVKLLNFLQSRKLIRVGGTKEISVDVRVISATNKNLTQMVKEKRFREDLYYRLHVVPIYIPPLRERSDDIYPAACYFAKKYRSKYHKYFEFSDEFLKSLLHHEWKGNMRELENYMERMVVMNGGEQHASLEPAAEQADSNDSKVNPMGLAEKLENYEAELVREAYKKTPNSYRVAETLGISQPSAYRKIKKYVKDSDTN